MKRGAKGSERNGLKSKNEENHEKKMKRQQQTLLLTIIFIQMSKKKSNTEVMKHRKGTCKEDMRNNLSNEYSKSHWPRLSRVTLHLSEYSFKGHAEKNLVGSGKRKY